MLFKAGILSLALLLLSRLFGLLRESAQAAAFGATGLGDVVVLMLTLPDWLTGVLASGALSYVLLPRWAGLSRSHCDAEQRRLAQLLWGLGLGLAGLLWLARDAGLAWLLPGLAAAPDQWSGLSAWAWGWALLALPLALWAALGVTRLQHERDVLGQYAANLVVNVVVVLALLAAGAGMAWVGVAQGLALHMVGTGLLLAMVLRLAWLAWRQRHLAPSDADGAKPASEVAAGPARQVWMWAVLSAALPLAFPFIARSIASSAGEGALATFSYAWKLLELPLILAIQLLASLSFPAVARALSLPDSGSAAAATSDLTPVRRTMLAAWALACAAVAALLIAAPALAQLLFGWGRMQGAALQQLSDWVLIGAWGLLPQALLAVGLTVLAARQQMYWSVLAYGLALAVLWALMHRLVGGTQVMAVLNGLWLLAALVVSWRVWRIVPAALPWRPALVCLLLLLLWAWAAPLLRGWGGPVWQLAVALVAALTVLMPAFGFSPALRQWMKRG